MMIVYCLPQDWGMQDWGMLSSVLYGTVCNPEAKLQQERQLVLSHYQILHTKFACRQDKIRRVAK